MIRLELVDILHGLRALEDTGALWATVRDYYIRHGVQRISYHRYRGVSGARGQAERGVTVVAEGFPDDWVSHYVGQKLYRVDPIPELARNAGTPVFWSDAERIARLSPAQKAYIAEFDEADLGDGLAIHVFGPDMQNAYVGLGFGHDPREIPPGLVTEFQCVAQMGHLRYCEMAAAQEEARFDLSPREREILHWIARGKSNAVIGTILDLSPHTVDTLTRRLFDKLGVNDRVSAAIRGVGSGLVLPG